MKGRLELADLENVSQKILLDFLQGDITIFDNCNANAGTVPTFITARNEVGARLCFYRRL